MSGFAKTLMILGAVLFALGAALSLGGGKLPGDFVIRRRNWTLYFPFATSILLSLVLTLALWLWNRMR
jgi:hypothetical protein